MGVTCVLLALRIGRIEILNRMRGIQLSVYKTFSFARNPQPGAFSCQFTKRLLEIPNPGQQ